MERPIFLHYEFCIRPLGDARLLSHRPAPFGSAYADSPGARLR